MCIFLALAVANSWMISSKFNDLRISLSILNRDKAVRRSWLMVDRKKFLTLFRRENERSPLQLLIISDKYNRNPVSTFGKHSIMLESIIILYIQTAWLSSSFFSIFEKDVKVRNCWNSLVKSTGRSSGYLWHRFVMPSLTCASDISGDTFVNTLNMLSIYSYANIKYRIMTWLCHSI